MPGQLPNPLAPRQLSRPHIGDANINHCPISLPTGPRSDPEFYPALRVGRGMGFNASFCSKLSGSAGA